MKTVVGQDDFACMAETVRRRYTRLLNESKVQRPKSSEVRSEGGEAIPQELQKLVDETSEQMRRGHKGSESRLQAASDRLKPGLQTANLPDLILIDGGKGQLNAACAELAKLGLNHIPSSAWRRSSRRFTGRR